MVFWLKKLLGITNKNQVGEVKFERPIESNIFEAYEKGVSLYRKKRHDEALALLDVAADAGLVYAYHWQALCLQYLDFHLDAIDAFKYSRKSNLVVCSSNRSEQLGHVGEQGGGGLVGLGSQPVVLAKAPQDFDAVEFRRVRR